MAETPDQARPLAPAADRPTSSDDEAPATTASRRRRRLLKCCAFAAALLLIQAAVVVALVFTVFRVRDPIIRMNGVAVERIDLVNGSGAAAAPRPGSNMTLRADVSVKNPNFASFRYRNTTTAIYYRGEVIGEARGPPGRARARRTMRMNVTVDVMTDRILSRPELAADLSSGLLTMGSYTVVGGRVKVLMIRRHVTVRMNCSMTVNTTSQALQEMSCRRNVDL